MKSDIVNFFQNLYIKYRYVIESLKDFNQHPYILEGEERASTHQTILIYRIRGSRVVFKMSPQDICNDSNLINKFHPLDIRKIAYIAGIEQILNVAPTERQKLFASFKEKIFNI